MILRLFILVLAHTVGLPTWAQPALKPVLFSDLSSSQLKKMDGEWEQFSQKNKLTEDQMLAWFDVRFHLYSRPGIAFTEKQKSALLELINQSAAAYPNTFATECMGMRLERNQGVTEKMPPPKSDFQKKMRDIELAKAEVLGLSGSMKGISIVLGMMTSEQKSYYANMLKCVGEGDVILVGGFEDALGLFATNMSAGVGKSCEIICLDALLNNTFRAKNGTQYLGHPAATGSPAEFVSRLIQKNPNHTAISVSTAFELYSEELDRLYIRGVLLAPKAPNAGNAILWKSFDKSQISKGKPLAANYLPMLNLVEKEIDPSKTAELKSIKDLIKSLQ